MPPPVDHSTGTSLRNWGTVGAVVPTGHILTVGPTGTFRTLESALAVARDGDTIQVAAGTYVNDFADINHKVIIEGVGGIARFVQSNDPSRQLGIFVANTDATIHNVELTGAANYNGHEAGLYVTAGNVTLVNSKVDGNNVGVGAGDNVASNLAIYNSDIGDNFDTAKGTHNITVGAINSLTIQGSYLHGAMSGHELSDQAFNSDIENNRIIDGANVGASFLIDLGAGGAATIKNNLLVKGAQAANGLLIHVGGEATTYSNSNVLVTGNTMVTQYSNPGHPYTYFVVGDPNKPIAPITVTGNTFVGGIPGSRWLTSATDGGNNRAGTTPPLDTSSPVSAAAVPALFAPQSGPNTLKLVLAEKRGDLDAKFVVTVDGVGAGGGTVTAPFGSATQTFSFSGTWTPGAHQVAVTIINSQTGNGGGAYALYVNSVSLDNSTVKPNVGLNRATYTATLTASAPAPAPTPAPISTPARPGEAATPAGFVAAYYLAHNPDVAAAHVDPLQHYLVRGWREGRDPSAFFDTNWYLARNPDVKASGMNPLLHYDLYGWQEGRDPSALFSTTAYLAANPDVAAAGVNPLDDYLDHGRAEGRSNVIAGSMARPIRWSTPPTSTSSSATTCCRPGRPRPSRCTGCSARQMAEGPQPGRLVRHQILPGPQPGRRRRPHRPAHPVRDGRLEAGPRPVCRLQHQQIPRGLCRRESGRCRPAPALGLVRAVRRPQSLRRVSPASRLTVRTGAARPAPSAPPGGRASS